MELHLFLLLACLLVASHQSFARLTFRQIQESSNPSTNDAGRETEEKNVQVAPCLLISYRYELQTEEDKLVWKCRLSGSDAQNAGVKFNGNHAYVDIKGIEFVLNANHNIMSHHTTLFAEGAVIEDHLLHISPFNELHFHTPATAIRRRRLATTSGNLDVLVARVVTTDSQPTAMRAEMSDAIFGTDGDLVNLKSQIEGCSDGKLTITPATGTGSSCEDNPSYLGFFQFESGAYANCDYFSRSNEDNPDICANFGDRLDLDNDGDTANGSCCVCGGGTPGSYDVDVVDGVVNVNLNALAANNLQELALNELESMFQESYLPNIVGLVILCMPPGLSETFHVFASTGGYTSAYSNEKCLFPSYQMVSCFFRR